MEIVARRLAVLGISVTLSAGAVSFGQSDAPIQADPINPVLRGEQPHETFTPPPEQTPGNRAVLTSVPALQGVGLNPVAFIAQVNVDSFGNNILNDAGNEPSIAVNPLNHNQMAIGWRQFDSVLNSFREAGVAFTTNGGQSWTNLPVFENGTFRSDPVLNYDANGVFFYNSLKVVNNVFDTWVFRSFNGGQTWQAPIFAFGGDKQWMGVDRTGGVGHGNIYQAWNLAGNQFSPAIFNRSLDSGLTWSTPITLPNSPIFGEVAVGPDGEVFVAGAASGGSVLTIVRSDNAKNPLVATPTFPQTSIINLGGRLVIGAAVNPVGLAGPLNIAVDFSPARRGWVYAVASIDPVGADPLDVKFSRSTDGGISWSTAQRLNDDALGTGSSQWFGTMSVSPNGRIDVIWNDTRGDPFNNFSAVFYCFSLDGGTTWSNNIQLTTPFDHRLGYPQQDKLGDYYDMISDNSGADVAFAATFNGEQDVYYMRITFPPCISNARDCNSNGLGDDCDITLGLADDLNGNGVPDACESGACLADTNRSGIVDFADITAVLTGWTTSGTPGRVGDATGDGEIRFDDITAVLSRWLQTCP